MSARKPRADYQNPAPPTRATTGGWWGAPGWRRAVAWIGYPYGQATARRMRRTPSAQSPIPVICIGNFVAGGAGKTPVAMAVARHLRELDLKPVFLTRGYRGQLRGPLLVDETVHTYLQVGDEALLLAHKGLTVVSVDRNEGARFATGMGADVVVMDDGFQNPSIRKDLSLVVVDGKVGLGNGLMLPVGPLRAPLAGQIGHADAIVVVDHTRAATSVVRECGKRGLPVLNARTSMTGHEDLIGQRVLAFAGLGRPAKFFQALTAAGVDLVAERAFPDHHAYAEADARALIRQANDQGLRLATTAKDAVRFSGARTPALASLAGSSTIVDVSVDFAERSLLFRLLGAVSPKDRRFDRGP